MTHGSPLRYVEASAEVIRLAVMLNLRFSLSLPNVEDLLHGRGVEDSLETVRLWWMPLKPMIAAETRLKQAGQLRSPRWRSYLDEVFVRISDVQHYFWRVLDHKAEVLEAFVSKTRHKKAALKFLRELMRRRKRLRTTLGVSSALTVWPRWPSATGTNK